MPQNVWEHHESDFALEWGGRTWTFLPGGENPGLWVRSGSRPIGPLLGLTGFAKIGRSLTGVFAGESLVSCHCIDRRVEATYRVGELTVRAAWEAAGDETVDLTVEVELAGDVAGVLRGFELLVTSVLPEPGRSRPKRWVEPRDAECAAFSYDGREADVTDLTTLPAPAADAGPLAPRVIPSPWDDGLSYVELSRQDEVARRVTESRKISSVGHTTRYGLFGRILQPGAVFSAWLRGIWLLSPSPQQEALEHAARFAADPGA